MDWHNDTIRGIMIRQTRDARLLLQESNGVLLPDWLLQDLLDDSNLYDPEINKRMFKNANPTIRVGNDYQATLNLLLVTVDVEHGLQIRIV